MVLHHSVGLVSEGNSPAGSADERIMCSSCFDQQSGDLVISEFPALAGGVEAEYDLHSEEDFSHASRLTGTPLNLEDMREEDSWPIICSQCNQTVGIVQCSSIEQ